MSTKYYNKVIVNDQTIIDLTSDTVTPETLVSGRVAHSADGSVIIGTKEPLETAESGNLSDSNDGDILDSSGNAITSEIGYITKAEHEDVVIGLKKLILHYEEVIDIYRANEQNYLLSSDYIPVDDYPPRI